MKSKNKEKVYPTSIAIKQYLLQNEFASPSDFYKVYRELKPTTSYESIAKYFYILRKLGLIEIDRYEPSGRRIPKSIYKLIPELVDDPRWESPQRALYPQK